MSAEPGKGGRIWPLMIALGLLVVVVVNIGFVVMAVRGADPVVESYHTEPR